jgi:phosphoribosylformylglycinamidine cyclo-ligase
VGVVERKQLIDGRSVVPGDVVLGIASSGLHANGYSLVRQVVLEIAGLAIDDPIPSLGTSVREILLEPTRIYTRVVREILRHYKVKNVVHAIAHITGGGLHENLQRVLPAGARAVIERGSWSIPPVFGWLQQLGEIDAQEMDRVFNMGLGLVLVVSSYYASNVRKMVAQNGLDCWEIGRIEQGSGEVTWSP